MHFIGSNSQVHCDKLQNRLSAEFSSMVLFYKVANCPWSLTKPQLCHYCILPSKTCQHHLETRAANV